MMMEGKTPKLRFREFSDFWKTKKLGNVVEITSASRVHKDEWTEIGIPFYRSSDIVAAFKGLNNTKAYISEELYKSLTAKTGCVKKNDILVTGGGSIGIPFLVKTDDPLYFKDADLLWLKNNEKVNGSFLFCFFTTPTFRKYLESISHIGTIAHYTVIQAKNTPFNSPSLPEQQKIASFLSSVDERIELLERKKEKLEAYKKGVMQQIFPSTGSGQAPQIRFKQDDGSDFPDWKEKRLEDVVNQFLVPMRDKPKSLDGSIPWCRIEDFDGKYLSTSKTNQGVSQSTVKDMRLKVFPINTLIVSCSAYLGRCAIVKKELVTNQTFIGLVPNEAKVDVEFLYYIMSLSERRLNTLSSGTTISYLSREQFEKFPVILPELAEQKKIAGFLNSIDENLETLDSQIQGLRTWKKGLLQQMFV